MIEIDEPELTVGAIVADRFKLEELLGQGGNGVVWSATDIGSSKQHALKFLKPGAFDARNELRLLREARAMAGIAHPNVARVFGILELPAGTPFMVMELLKGSTLRSWIERGPLSVDTTRHILLQVSEALRAAHAVGIVHRDLKPGNVIVDQDGGVKVLDFGIAKDLRAAGDASLTATGAIVGTLHYMAPEQVFGDSDIDELADVWALGIVAHECLTGRRPTAAPGEGSGQVLKAILSGTFPRLATVVTGCPAELDALVARMLSRDRAARPRIEEVCRVLRGDAAAGAVDADVEPRRRRGTRVWAAAGAVVVTGAALIAAIGSGALRRAAPAPVAASASVTVADEAPPVVASDSASPPALPTAPATGAASGGARSAPRASARTPVRSAPARSVSSAAVRADGDDPPISLVRH